MKSFLVVGSVSGLNNSYPYRRQSLVCINSAAHSNGTETRCRLVHFCLLTTGEILSLPLPVPSFVPGQFTVAHLETLRELCLLLRSLPFVSDLGSISAHLIVIVK